MKIAQISYFADNKRLYNKSYTQKSADKPLGNSFGQKEYNYEHVKANFIPSFNGYKKIGTVQLKERDTDDNVTAVVKKERIGDFISLKLFVKNKEAGYLDMECDSVLPNSDYALDKPSNIIPQIHHIRSIQGDKYKGIGTALIKTAIQESWNNGGFGNLWLVTETGYAKGYSKYRSNENPIPFYYKTGFESPDDTTDKLIKNCLEKQEYSKLPDSVLLMLTNEAKNKWSKELIMHPIIKSPGMAVVN